MARQSYTTEPLPCSFMEELIKMGPDVVLNWYYTHCEVLIHGEAPREGFNVWSQIAKRLSNAARRAIVTNDRREALTYAGVACRIYEGLLPRMTEDLSLLGTGSGISSVTEIEAIHIRVELINHFGPHDDPFDFTVDFIEKWFLKDLDLLGIDSPEATLQESRRPDLEPHRQAQLLSFHTHVRVVNRLNDNLRPTHFKNWLAAVG